jgi:hypothetical protein
MTVVHVRDAERETFSEDVYLENPAAAMLATQEWSMIRLLGSRKHLGEVEGRMDFVS